MENDGDRDAWLRSMMRSTVVTPSGACVDAETLATWAEGTLDAKHAEAVERHASNCSRCMAVLASMERIVPPAEEPGESWSVASLWRWLVPLTAVATAVAIWIVVPDRPVSQGPALSVPQQTTVPPELTPEKPAEKPPESGTAVSELQGAAPLTPSTEIAELEKKAGARQEPSEESRLRVNEARDSARPPAPSAPAARAARPDTPAADALAGAQNDMALTTLQRQELAAVVPTSESSVLTNPLIRWRVMNFTSVERSIDGGKTWIKTAPPPGVAANNTAAFAMSVVSVRAVDSLRASVTTSDGREFYTTNGGLAWERLQGNSTAPF